MVAVAALVAAFTSFVVLTLVLALAGALVALLNAVFAAFAARLFDFFTGAFVGEMKAFAVDTCRRFDFWRWFHFRRWRGFDFFTRAFIWNARAIAVDTHGAVLIETGAGKRTARAVAAG